MGDRCYVSVRYAAKDWKAFNAAVGEDFIPGTDEDAENSEWFETVEESDVPGVLEARESEANYGYNTQFCHAAEKGIIFCGIAGAGDEYGAELFASCGDGVLHGVAADEDEHPVVRVRDDGTVGPNELAAVRAYQAALKKVEAYFAGLGTAPEPGVGEPNCKHGFIGACAECDGAGQNPEHES